MSPFVPVFLHIITNINECQWRKRKNVNKNEQTGTKDVKTGNGVRGSGGAEGAHTRQKGKSRK